MKNRYFDRKNKKKSRFSQNKQKQYDLSIEIKMNSQYFGRKNEKKVGYFDILFLQYIFIKKYRKNVNFFENIK